MIKSCYNCQVVLKENDAFCSKCGQKVDDNNLRLKVVFRDFYENYLSLDTRIGRSIIPFLFQPGKLALEFIKGKRSTYVNPFRFYLVISIFFFFVLGQVVDKSFKSSNSYETREEKKQTDVIPDKESISSQLGNFAELIDSLQIADSAVVADKMDSLIKANGLDEQVKYNVDSAIKKKNFVNINSDGLGFNIDVKQLKLLKQYRYDENYTNRDLLDSIQTDTMNMSTTKIGLQFIKLYRSDQKVISKFVLGNLSLAILILIPGLALLFMLFYFKEKKTFVAHLIHSIQFHTFSLFVYGICLIFVYYYLQETVFWFAFLSSAIYLFFSLKKLYPRGNWATFWRYTSIGLIYYVYWSFVLVSSTLIFLYIF